MFSQPDHNIEFLDIQPGMSVLECGVGAGDYTLPLATRVGAMGNLYIADIQKNLLQRAKSEAEIKNHTHIHSLWTDFDMVDSLKKIPDGVIDRIMVASLLFQIEHPQRFLQECARIMKKGAILLCVDWSESFGHIGPHPEAIVHPDTAQQYATKAGLQIRTSAIDVGPHHYGYVAYK